MTTTGRTRAKAQDRAVVRHSGQVRCHKGVSCGTRRALEDGFQAEQRQNQSIFFKNRASSRIIYPRDKTSHRRSRNHDEKSCTFGIGPTTFSYRPSVKKKYRGIVCTSNKTENQKNTQQKWLLFFAGTSSVAGCTTRGRPRRRSFRRSSSMSDMMGVLE